VRFPFGTRSQFRSEAFDEMPPQKFILCTFDGWRLSACVIAAFAHAVARARVEKEAAICGLYDEPSLYTHMPESEEEEEEDVRVSACLPSLSKQGLDGAKSRHFGELSGKTRAHPSEMSIFPRELEREPVLHMLPPTLHMCT